MSIDWNEVNRVLSPTKSYAELCLRWQESLSYTVIRAAYNFTMPEINDYLHRLLGGDARARYTGYEALLTPIFAALDQAGVKKLLDLAEQVFTPEGYEHLADHSRLPAEEIAEALKFLTYWFVPMPKPLNSLVREEPVVLDAVKRVREVGVRTNLDMLERGSSAAGRAALGEASDLPGTVVLELTNRADFSRLPWASKATISNIIGAGYGSLKKLAGAEPRRLFDDFFRYGQSIGKNLKLGNEIENSYRIAKLLPVILQDE